MRALLRPGRPAGPTADRSRRRQQGQGLDRGHAGSDPDTGRLSHRPVHLAAPVPRRGAHPGRRPADHGRRTDHSARRRVAILWPASRGWSRPSSRWRRRWASCTFVGGASRRRWWRWDWAAASIRPTSAGRRWRSSPASASTTCSSSATRLASIAMEKAGIIKPGRPVVSGATVRRRLAPSSSASLASAGRRCVSSASISAMTTSPAA